MTTREAARPLRRYLRARVRAASLPPTYTITRDVTGCSALPANLQVQQLGFCTLDDRDIADQQTQHSLAVAS